MNNCNCNSLKFNKSKVCKSFNFSSWDRFTAYYNNNEKQDFVEYNHNLYGCIKSVGADEINPKDDTNDGRKEGKYWIRVVSGIKGEVGGTWVPSISKTGDLSWSKESDKDPETVNIMGPRGYSVEYRWNGSNLLVKREDENSWSSSPELKSDYVYIPKLENNNLTWELKEKPEINLIDFGRIVGKSAYEEAVEQGFDGSKEDWLNSLKGDPGSNIILRVKDNFLQWKYDFEEVSEYRNLFYLNTLVDNLNFSEALEIEIDKGKFYRSILSVNGKEITNLDIPRIDKEDFKKDFIEKNEFTKFVDDTNNNINNITQAITWENL